MAKFRSIQFKGHPILGDLFLDFTLDNGEPADNIIIAGENGTGKSTLLKFLHAICSDKLICEAEISLDTGHNLIRITIEKEEIGDDHYFYFWNDSMGYHSTLPSHDLASYYNLTSIYSDVAINFNASRIRGITTRDIDSSNESTISNSKTPTEIEQLLVDISVLDALDVVSHIKKLKGSSIDTSTLTLNERVGRFSRAFDQMFDNLKYLGIRSYSDYKDINFSKYGKEISIRDLSSGEKQIIYRAGFLLKDINATRGAFVLIDEPEIALHPEWQKKILSFYKGIFTNNANKQTSQLFVVTHSPFIIHNLNRQKDKLIVLKRNEQGIIEAQASPEYYFCDGIKAIEDAFNITDFSDSTPTIYLEGRTDELYFKKALDLSDITNFPFSFKWVGHLERNGQEANTGKDALNKAFQFLIGENPSKLHICLYDCDTNIQPTTRGNVKTLCLPTYTSNQADIKAGIENALIISEELVHPFRIQRPHKDQYGNPNIRYELDKMALCSHICDELSPDKQRLIFQNLIKALGVLLNEYQQHMSTAL